MVSSSWSTAWLTWSATAPGSSVRLSTSRPSAVPYSRWRRSRAGRARCGRGPPARRASRSARARAPARRGRLVAEALRERGIELPAARSSRSRQPRTRTPTWSSPGSGKQDDRPQLGPALLLARQVQRLEVGVRDDEAGAVRTTSAGSPSGRVSSPTRAGGTSRPATTSTARSRRHGAAARPRSRVDGREGAVGHELQRRPWLTGPTSTAPMSGRGLGPGALATRPLVQPDVSMVGPARRRRPRRAGGRGRRSRDRRTLLVAHVQTSRTARRPRGRGARGRRGRGRRQRRAGQPGRGVGHPRGAQGVVEAVLEDARVAGDVLVGQHQEGGASAELAAGAEQDPVQGRPRAGRRARGRDRGRGRLRCAIRPGIRSRRPQLGPHAAV